MMSFLPKLTKSWFMMYLDLSIESLRQIRKQGIDTTSLYDPSKVWIAEDHFVPSAEKISAENIVKLSNFSKNTISKNISSMEWVNMEYAIHSHMKKHWLIPVALPGGDSHTNTTGGLGAFACGLGHTDVAYVLLNGEICPKYLKHITSNLMENCHRM